MSRTLLTAGLRDLLRRPLHTGLMVLGVALGVAVVVAIDLANESARLGFARSTEAVTGRATHQILGGSAGLPEDLLRRIREQGLRRSTPVVDGVVVARDLDRQPLRVLGLDPFSDGPFRPYLGARALDTGRLARLMVDPRAAVVGSALADAYRLRIGSPLRVQVADRVAELEVSGIVHSTDESETAALEGLILLDVGSAQRLLGLGDRVTRIDLIASPGELARIAPLLPPSARIVRASEQADTTAQLTAAFQLNLTALSLLALVVGMFLIYNTVTFSVVQRRPVIGTLRLLGATPGQVFGLILTEAAAAAAAGSAIGLGLGFVLGQGAVRLVTRTINDLYFTLAVSGASLTPTTVARGALLGLGAGVLSAVLPALEAARVEPVEALRRSVLEGKARWLVPRVALAGVAVAFAGSLVLALSSRSLTATFAGLFAIVLGFALVAPLATVVAMALASPVAGRLAGTLGRLATGAVSRAVSRTGVAVAALAVAVSVTIGVGLMIESFRATVDNWLDLTLRADVFVSAPSRGGARSFAPLPPDVERAVAAVPGVAWVETFRSVRVESDLGEVNLGVADPRRARDTRLYRFAEGDPAEAWGRVLGGAVLVTEPFAYRHGLPRRGASVTLRTDRGRRSFPVVGVLYDYATDQGTVFLTRNVYERYWDDRALTSVGAHLAPGAKVEDVTRAIRASLAGRALRVTPNLSLRRGALRIFDRTFAVTEALRLLAVVVAFIGVCSALVALQVERTRELGTLVALGLGERQQRTLMLLETGLMGGVAGLLSLPLGWLLAWLLVRVINVRSFSWTMHLVWDPWLFVEALALSVGAAVLASVYPLLRLRRLPLAAALRAD
jgi:putative ABC transport system permease protein